MHNVPVLSFDDFAKRYFGKYLSAAAIEDLRGTLNEKIATYQCDGFVLLECQVLDSSRLGELTILPYGPNNTFKEPPTHPVSPRGLASDMAVVVATMPTAALGAEAACPS